MGHPSGAQTGAIDRRTILLRIAAFAFASMSLAALVAHVFGFVPLPFFLTFVGLPSVLALFALAALARRIHADYFLNAIGVGLAAGLCATIVYDGVRGLLQATHPFGYNGFVPILLFGSWITGQPMTSPIAALAGWVYHYWNGLSFAIMYVMIFGNRHWLFGVGYGIFMELCMLGLFPMFIRVSNKLDFILISMVGHLFYGAALGLIASRYARSV